MKEAIVYKRVTVRADEKILEKIRCMAGKEGRSLSRQIVWMVKKQLETDQAFEEQRRTTLSSETATHQSP